MLGEIIGEAHRAGFPVALHAVEEEAVAAAAQALGEFPLGSPLQKEVGGISGSQYPSPAGRAARDRIEHCAECPTPLVDEVRRSGAVVVTQPGFVYWNGENYRERVEPSLLPHLYPVGALAQVGVPLAFGSDAPVIDPNPWPAIGSAVTRCTDSGNPLAPTDGPGATTDQRVSVGQALRMYTLGGACAEGSQARKGVIRPGNLADLVLVDADPTGIDPAGLKEIRAVLTLVGGRVVWERPGR